MCKIIYIKKCLPKKQQTLESLIYLYRSTDLSLKELQKLRQLLVWQFVHDLHGQVFCAAHLGSKLAGVGLAGSHVPNIVDQVFL